MFTRYTPKNAIPNVFYLKDSGTGKDWYEIQKSINRDTLKIAVDKENNIRFSFYDPSSVFPEDCTIFEPEKFPDNFISAPHNWTYSEGNFSPIVNSEAYKVRSETKILEELKSEYRDLKLRADLGISSEEDVSRIEVIRKRLLEKMKI
jgi:hypothetical protein